MGKLDSWPVSALRKYGQVALDAYTELCVRCDAGVLNWNLLLLQDRETNSLDTYAGATGGLKRADLRRISRDAANLRLVVERLRKAAFIAAAAHDSILKQQDLLHWACNLDEHFRGLADLTRLAEEIGPRRRPDFNQTLDGLLKYVRARCGRPMYPQLEILFEALAIPAQNLAQRKYDRANKPKSRKRTR
jgi:hypothetical protein